MNKKIILATILLLAITSSKIALGQGQVMTLEAPTKKACNQYKGEIKKYEDMAKQPQSGEMQDWIRNEVVKIRRLQANTKCESKSLM